MRSTTVNGPGAGQTPAPEPAADRLCAERPGPDRAGSAGDQTDHRVAGGGPTDRVPGTTSRLELRLMSGFALLRDGEPVEVQPRGQRLLALLALRDHPLSRSHVAATLWLDSDEEQGLASLRSTLWRLNQDGRVVVAGSAGRLALDDEMAVDVVGMIAQARRLTDGDGPVDTGDDDVGTLRGDLLPGWWDDWVVVEREWLRQLQLHALEQLARRLGGAGRYTRALEAGLAAIAAEPLRESAHRTVVGLHLAEGNRSEALRQYRSYERLLATELSAAPTEQMRRLVGADAGDASRPVTSR